MDRAFLLKQRLLRVPDLPELLRVCVTWDVLESSYAQPGEKCGETRP